MKSNAVDDDDAVHDNCEKAAPTRKSPLQDNSTNGHHETAGVVKSRGGIQHICHSFALLEESILSLSKNDHDDSRQSVKEAAEGREIHSPSSFWSYLSSPHSDICFRQFKEHLRQLKASVQDQLMMDDSDMVDVSQDVVSSLQEISASVLSLSAGSSNASDLHVFFESDIGSKRSSRSQLLCICKKDHSATEAPSSGGEEQNFRGSSSQRVDDSTLLTPPAQASQASADISTVQIKKENTSCTELPTCVCYDCWSRHPLDRGLSPSTGSHQVLTEDQFQIIKTEPQDQFVPPDQQPDGDPTDRNKSLAESRAELDGADEDVQSEASPATAQNAETLFPVMDPSSLRENSSEDDLVLDISRKSVADGDALVGGTDTLRGDSVVYRDERWTGSFCQWLTESLQDSAACDQSDTVKCSEDEDSFPRRRLYKTPTIHSLNHIDSTDDSSVPQQHASIASISEADCVPKQEMSTRSPPTCVIRAPAVPSNETQNTDTSLRQILDDVCQKLMCPSDDESISVIIDEDRADSQTASCSPHDGIKSTETVQNGASFTNKADAHENESKVNNEDQEEDSGDASGLGHHDDSETSSDNVGRYRMSSDSDFSSYSLGSRYSLLDPAQKSSSATAAERDVTAAEDPAADSEDCRAEVKVEAESVKEERNRETRSKNNFRTLAPAEKLLLRTKHRRERAREVYSFTSSVSSLDSSSFCRWKESRTLLSRKAADQNTAFQEEAEHTHDDEMEKCLRSLNLSGSEPGEDGGAVEVVSRNATANDGGDCSSEMIVSDMAAEGTPQPSRNSPATSSASLSKAGPTAPIENLANIKQTNSICSSPEPKALQTAALLTEKNPQTPDTFQVKKSCSSAEELIEQATSGSGEYETASGESLEELHAQISVIVVSSDDTEDTEPKSDAENQSSCRKSLISTFQQLPERMEAEGCAGHTDPVSLPVSSNTVKTTQRRQHRTPATARRREAQPLTGDNSSKSSYKETDSDSSSYMDFTYFISSQSRNQILMHRSGPSKGKDADEHPAGLKVAEVDDLLQQLKEKLGYDFEKHPKRHMADRCGADAGALIVTAGIPVSNLQRTDPEGEAGSEDINAAALGQQLVPQTAARAALLEPSVLPPPPGFDSTLDESEEPQAGATSVMKPFSSHIISSVLLPSTERSRFLSTNSLHPSAESTHLEESHSTCNVKFKLKIKSSNTGSETSSFTVRSWEESDCTKKITVAPPPPVPEESVPNPDSAGRSSSCSGATSDAGSGSSSGSSSKTSGSSSSDTATAASDDAQPTVIYRRKKRPPASSKSARHSRRMSAHEHSSRTRNRRSLSLAADAGQTGEKQKKQPRTILHILSKNLWRCTNRQLNTTGNASVMYLPATVPTSADGLDKGNVATAPPLPCAITDGSAVMTMTTTTTTTTVTTPSLDQHSWVLNSKTLTEEDMGKTVRQLEELQLLCCLPRAGLEMALILNAFLEQDKQQAFYKVSKTKRKQLLNLATMCYIQAEARPWGVRLKKSSDSRVPVARDILWVTQHP